MKVRIERTLGLLPCQQTVELEVDDLPEAIEELRHLQPCAHPGAADTSRLRLWIEGRKEIDVDETACRPEQLDALDELWERGHAAS